MRPIWPALIFKQPQWFLAKLGLWRCIKKMAPHLSGCVLDVGSGKSPYARLIRYTRRVQIEIDARRRPDVQASALSLPFREESFDSVLCTEVLEHLSDPQRAVNEIARVLKPGGVALISAPMGWALHYEPHDYFRFTHYGLQHLLSSSGLRAEQTLSSGGLLRIVGVHLAHTLYKLGMFIFLPFELCRPLRKFLAACLALPVNLVFAVLARIAECFGTRFHMGWVVRARKA